MCFHTSQTKKVVELENRYDASLSDDEARDAYDIPRYHLNGFSHPDMHIKHKNNDVLSLAGLYTLVGSVVTFTILTKKASPLFAKIHNKKNRQPIILQKDFEQEWLKDDLNENGIKELINLNFNEEELSTYTVSRDLFQIKVNTDTESIIDEVKYDGVVI